MERGEIFEKVDSINRVITPNLTRNQYVDNLIYNYLIITSKINIFNFSPYNLSEVYFSNIMYIYHLEKLIVHLEPS